WKAIGRALEICRTESMRAAHTNKPLGRAYNSEMSLLLKRYGFDDIAPAERSRLNACMANLDQIEAWLATLKPKEQIKLNNPKSHRRPLAIAPTRRARRSNRSGRTSLRHAL